MRKSGVEEQETGGGPGGREGNAVRKKDITNGGG